MGAADTRVLGPRGRTGPRERLGEMLVARGLVAPEQVDAALQVQARTGDRLGRILTALGAVRRPDLYRALAEQWGLAYVDLVQHPPAPDPARRFDPEVLARFRFVPVGWGNSEVVVATAEPPDETLREVLRQVLGPVPIRFVATTDWDVDYALRKLFPDVIADRAALQLYYRSPEDSARQVLVRWQRLALAGSLASLALGLAFWPGVTARLLMALVNVGFFAHVAFRFITSLAGAWWEHLEPVTQEEVRLLPEAELPTYTVLVPLYREARVVPGLLSHLVTLDYPASKLEVLLLVEEDDHETLVAVRAAKPPAYFTVVTVPPGQPRTKPKALNVGLLFARGEFLVIYDAEDRFERDQLRKAVAAFRKGPERLTCVQAALNYYNREENTLTRLFAMEYAQWFDYLLPGLFRLGLPIPLGGTSNHFRTERLRQLGGWDPFNVTEDADLGLRMAGRGFTVAVLNSTTWEEAPHHLAAWIRQRSRWIKGYMQTALVHGRNPWRLWRAAGLRGVVGWALPVAGSPISFLAAPILWALYLVWLATGTRALDPFLPVPILYVSLFNLLLGNGMLVYLNTLAVFKRQWFRLLPYTLLTPLYWTLHSVAAYRALLELVRRPFHWEKTEHGISRFVLDRSPAESR